jgi:predicted glycoside hydrolase/deacetylase ChbG (UPF0249 family)
MAGAEGGGIFVSYRRQESKHFAGRLYDRLAHRFGKGQVFIDVDAIELGVDFAEAISRAVAACQVLLAVIGPSWLTITDEQGRRRLDDPDDIVRLEVEAALARDVRVIPILVEGAHMPRRDDLPDSLTGLARRNPLLIRHESFSDDAGRLVRAIERVLVPIPGPAAVHQSPSLGEAVSPVIPRADEAAQQGPAPAPGDRDRGARLFTEAERIAQSIAGEALKAHALAGVAQALAATDPDRAERLLTDAEHLAQTLTNWYQKTEALTAVAQALAATDPGRAEQLLTDAEHLAQTLPGDVVKAQTLAPIARALAAIDADRAERIAQSITDEYRKTEALADVAQALAATDADRAERIAQSITDEYRKAEALAGVAQALAATDPDRAEQLLTDAEHLAQTLPGNVVMAPIARALAATDADRAERIAQSITDEYRKALALAGVAQVLTASSM